MILYKGWVIRTRNEILNDLIWCSALFSTSQQTQLNWYLFAYPVMMVLWKIMLYQRYFWEGCRRGMYRNKNKIVHVRNLPHETNTCPATHKISSINGTLRFITAQTRAPHLLLSWARLIQSIPPSCFSSVIHRNKLISLGRGMISPTPNPQAWGPTLVSRPRLLIQYCHVY